MAKEIRYLREQKFESNNAISLSLGWLWHVHPFEAIQNDYLPGVTAGRRPINTN
jgi:hypothetical protein